MSGIERIASPEVREAGPGLWSNALRANGVLYLSGLTSRDAQGRVVGDDEYSQATTIFRRIGHLLAAAGAAPADIVKLNLYLTRIDQREAVWRARREFLDADGAGRCFPAATLVEVSSLQPGILVEIEAIAHPGLGGRPPEVGGAA
jgi:enamine deaminase RidA (YjgF/YER057c/UK114 family)